MTARDIQRLIIRDRFARSTTLPNYTPPSWFECDVFELTASGFFREYEIKLSRGDFSADRSKAKSNWMGWNLPKTQTKHDLMAAGSPRGPSRFSFVTPAGLIGLDDLPPFAGWFEIVNSRLVLRRHPPVLHRRTRLDLRTTACETSYWRFIRLFLQTADVPAKRFSD